MSSGSWQKVTFDQICKNISDRIEDPKQAKTDYYVGLEHLDSEDPKISRHGSPQDVSKTKLLFKPGHILFGKRNWYLRRLAVAECDGICSAHMLVLEPVEGKIIKEFVPLLMFSDDFYEKALTVSAGSMSPTIKWKDISKLEFLIPSISEQENILSITQKIDETISNAQKLLEKTKNYAISRRESLLTRGIGHTKFKKVQWLFEKTIEIPEEWDYVQFSTVIDTNPKTDFKENIVPYIPMDAVDIEKSDISYHEKRVLKKSSNLPRFKINDTLFARITPSTENGKTTLIQNLKFGLASTELIVLRPTEKVLPFYLYYYVKSNRIRQYAISQMIGGTNRQRVPDIVFTRDLFFELPSITEQQKIVSNIFNIDEQINQQQSHLTNLKVLKKSILNSKLKKEKVLVIN